MLKTTVVSNIPEIARLMDTLGARISPEVARTVTRMARGVKIRASKKIGQITGLKMSELPKKYAKWHLHAATPANLTASHIISSQRLPMEYFFPSPTSVMVGKTSGGVKVNLMGKTVSLKHSFMGEIYGRKTIWARSSTLSKKFKKKNRGERELPLTELVGGEITGPEGLRSMSIESLAGRLHGSLGVKKYLRSRFPVTPRTFMSIAQIAEKTEVKEYIAQGAEVRFIKEFDRNLARLLKDYK